MARNHGYLNNSAPLFQKALTITSSAPFISLTDLTDLDALARRWRALETRAGASFFQSWTWVGCLAAERFPDPVVLAVQHNGQDLALALFNRRTSRLSPQTLWLGESGMPSLDAMYVEHNGILLDRDHTGLLAPCLRAALGPAMGRRLVLSGVDDAHLQAARHTDALVRVQRSQPAPYIDFTDIAPDANAFLEGLGPNTRYQLRRSARRYAAAGPLHVHRATSIAEAHDMLDELARLHQVSWVERGRSGAFANPYFRKFHRELITRAMPRGEVDLLRISAGAQLIGCLYNFRLEGCVLAYQSGFNYPAAGPHQKPGLTSHHLAIDMYRAEGEQRYDFLAGEERYKSSLSNASTTMHWFDVVPTWSPRGVITRLLGMNKGGQP